MNALFVLYKFWKKWILFNYIIHVILINLIILKNNGKEYKIIILAELRKLIKHLIKNIFKLLIHIKILKNEIKNLRKTLFLPKIEVKI